MFISADISTAKTRLGGGSQAPDSPSTLSFDFTLSFVDQLSYLLFSWAISFSHSKFYILAWLQVTFFFLREGVKGPQNISRSLILRDWTETSGSEVKGERLSVLQFENFASASLIAKVTISQLSHIPRVPCKLLLLRQQFQGFIFGVHLPISLQFLSTWFLWLAIRWNFTVFTDESDSSNL